jgi:hypothetical protein
MDRFGYDQADGGRTGAFQRNAEAFLAYLKSRKAEHWVMFLAGLALGALLG